MPGTRVATSAALLENQLSSSDTPTWMAATSVAAVLAGLPTGKALMHARSAGTSVSGHPAVPSCGPREHTAVGAQRLR